MVDNREQIKKLMHFEIEGDVYYIQVMQRSKDNHGRDHIIKDYHIHSFEHFEREWPNIKEMCDNYHARAMIRLNQRNTLDANICCQIKTLQTQLEVNRVLRKMIRTKQPNLGLPNILSAAKLYSSALGSTCSEASETKKWIIDIDASMVDPNRAGFESLTEIAKTFSDYIVTDCADRKKLPKIYCMLPSKSGLHIVTSPFRKDVFVNHFGKPSSQEDYIMTDANTNLYIADGEVTVSEPVEIPKPTFGERVKKFFKWLVKSFME